MVRSLLLLLFALWLAPASAQPIDRQAEREMMVLSIANLSEIASPAEGRRLDSPCCR
ncbi:MAG TPA: hypothetical protein VF655_00955 [Allosphingosinicella sp.]